MRTANRTGLPAQTGLTGRLIPDHLVPARSGAGAWWSNLKREGEWVLPRIFRAFTFMGNVELDLTFAGVGEGESEIEINCIMGNVTVTVPPEIRVICNGDSFVGSFDVERRGNTTPPPDAPTLIVSGTAYFGNVTISVIDPNAPGIVEKLMAQWAALKK